MVQLKETFHQSLAIMTVGFNEFCAGMGMGWTAPTLLALQKSDSALFLSVAELSWIASVDNFGRVLGGLLSAILLDKIGRRPILTMSGLIFFTVWSIIIFTKSVYTICAMRILYGVAVGFQTGSGSVYMGENLSPSMRGVFGTLAIALYNFGIFLEYIIATYFSFRTTAITNFSIQGLLFLASFWLREPVQFLLMKGKQKQALENFMWLKGVTDANDVKNDFEKITLNVQTEQAKKASFSKVLTSPANYKSAIIIMSIYILSSLTGYWTIMSYASAIFPASGIMSANEFTILFAATQLIVTLVASFLVDNFNRRSLILISFSIVAFIHSCTALLYYLQNNYFEIPYFPWVIFFSITLYSAVHVFAYPAIYLIRSELFPLSIRALATCLCMIGLAVTNFIMTKLFFNIYKNYGIHYNFMIFSASSWTLVIFVYFALPETRNKSLLEIQEILEKQK
ncbi:solute carrier family 2, facilitated glucose transporter member 6-like [Planococcus citri]|uniref:solute carrier family 2, facilitated glucose transporter member 6-like n=1 Tax=Planococcus citri TaxID=170843 RepID=UPI0031F97C7B